MRLIITLLFLASFCNAEFLKIDDQFLTVSDPLNTATVAYDLSGHNNTGTIYGAVLTGTNLYFDGNDYVDTGLYPEDNWQYYCKFKYLSLDGYKYLFGVEDTTEKRVGFGTASAAWRTVYGSAKQNKGISDTLEHEVFISNNYFYVDNVLIYNGAYTFVGTSALPLWLGGRNYSSPDSFANCIIEDFKCYTNNVLIQHFDFTERQKKYIDIQ